MQVCIIRLRSLELVSPVCAVLNSRKAILKSLMDLAKLQNELFDRTIRIIVFSRFDGRIVNPFDDPVVYEL